MTTADDISILLGRPPSPETLPDPPQTLSELTAFISAVEWTSHAVPAPAEEGDAKAGTLLEAMAHIAVDHRRTHCVCPTLLHPDLLQALMDALHARPGQLKLSLACRIGDTPRAPLSVPERDESIVQIVWRTIAPMPALDFFKAVSRAGIWNHLVLDASADTAANRGAIARQPNIIHSWEARDRDPADHATDDGYHNLPPLPGRPLWQIAGNAAQRFMLIERFGKSWMMRSRADDHGDRIITLGEAMTYHFRPPDQLPEGYLDEICAMVAAGGTVAATHVRSNLERAYLIGYVVENGVIVGNSSLKHPRPQYIEDVHRQSGLDLSGFVERGYTSVRPEYRGLGIGTRLLEGLTARAGDRKIFSVIAEDNEATKIIARRNRTRQVASYYSEKAGKPVGIWMPEWMIDDHEQRDA